MFGVEWQECGQFQPQILVLQSLELFRQALPTFRRLGGCELLLLLAEPMNISDEAVGHRSTADIALSIIAAWSCRAHSTPLKGGLDGDLWRSPML